MVESPSEILWLLSKNMAGIPPPVMMKLLQQTNPPTKDDKKSRPRDDSDWYYKAQNK